MLDYVVQDMRRMSMDDHTASSLEVILDQLTTLRHLMFASVSTNLLYSVTGKLPLLETLCATSVSDGITSQQP